jgi:hypothetical protein
MAVWTIPHAKELGDSGRWDAEAFSPFLRSLDAKFRKCPLLSELATVTHPSEIIRDYSDAEDSKLFLLAQNIRPLLPDTSTEFRIPTAVAAAIPINRLIHGDVLVTRSGAHSGMCAIYLGASGECYTSGEGLIVRSRGNVDGAYLAAFFNTTAGQALCRRAIYGSGQPHIGPKYLECAHVPRLGKIEDKASKLIRSAYAELKRAEKLYPEAEAELLDRIGWDELRMEPSELSYVCDFTNLTSAARSDAEFFQPRIQKIKGVLGQQGKQLRDVVSLREELFAPNPTQSFHYIEISDVLENGVLGGSEVSGSEAPSRAKYMVHPNDVITSTVRPIRRLSGIVATEQDGWVCSSGFAVLTPKQIPPEYLTMYLRLPPICEVLDASTTASMYPAISVPDLLSIPFYLPDKKLVEKICSAVRDARTAKAAAHAKLEEAKQLVEAVLNEA